MTLQIAPSILAADFAHLADAAASVSNADWLHVDVMDNHFVPNLTLGLPVVESLVAAGPLPLDCHLMITEPDRWAPGYAEAGAGSVTFHAEAAADAAAIVRDLHRAGARAGLAIKPGTALDDVAHLLGDIDMLLVMTVEPGFGGQSFIEACLDKVRAARALISAGNLDLWVQVDGGVSAATIARCADAGADVFVAGSAVFGAESASRAVDGLRVLAAAGC